MIKVVKKFPTNVEFNKLLDTVEWGKRDNKIINKQRAASCFAVSAYDKDNIVGMGRVIGDGSNFIIFDLVVDEAYQNKGIGTQLMDAIIKWFEKNRDEHGRLMLFSAGGVESFYEKLGFVTRPYEYLGAGMIYIK